MEQYGTIKNILIILLFIQIEGFGQSQLGNQVIFSEDLILGVQLPSEGSVRPGSGVVRLIYGNSFSSFTHYQYGTTIRTNYNDVNFISLSPEPQASILNIKRNYCNNCYGNRLEIRDRNDIKSLEFSTGFLHIGEASISISASCLTISNTSIEGETKIIIGTNLVGTFNQFGFQYPQYTMAQRDTLQNLNSGTTIYNITLGKNETWSGSFWQ